MKYSLFVFLFFVSQSAAYSEPLWNSTECNLNKYILPQYQIPVMEKNLAHFYVESDWATEMDACTTDPQFEFSEFNVRTIVKDAAEIWNAESRSPFLRYGGTFSTSPDSVCTPGSGAFPQIFVSFQPGCIVRNGECFGAYAEVQPIAACQNAYHIVMVGTSTDPAPSSNGCIDTPSSGTGTVFHKVLFKGTMTHEFGHTFGLDHYSSDSIMAGGPDGHLFPIDKDCVDEGVSPARSATARSLSFSSGGVLKEDEPLTYWYTQKGSLNGFPWRNNQVDYYAYSILHPDPIINHGRYRRAGVGSDGYLSWTDTGHHWAIANQLNYNPHFTNVDPGLYNNANVYWQRDLNRQSDPPEIYGMKTSDDFVNRIWQQVWYWDTATFPSKYSKLKSHVPLVSAFDPVSEQTIFVSVETDREFDIENNNYLLSSNDIRVFPRRRPGFSYAHLDSYELVGDNVSAPADSYASWNYELTTLYAPGVVCADSVPAAMNGFNCLIAWIDNGTPDNRILYTWFRVSGGNVIWHGTAYVRSGTYALNHISLGFYNNKIHLAYKNTSSSVDIGYTYNSLSSFWSWSGVTTFVRPGFVVDPPSWSTIGDGREAALLFTEK